MVKLIISGLRFYFHTYIFFLCKSPSFFLILKHFLKLRGFFNSDFLKISGVFLKKLRCFQNSGFFWKPSFYCPFSSPEPVVSWSRGREPLVGYKLSRVALGTRMFIVLNDAHVICLLTTTAGSKKMNMMALMIKMVFICFMLHVPLDGNY